MKSCCFIGHRNTKLTDIELLDLKNIIEDLIVNHGVSRFLFGSKSDFNYLCHDIVTQLKDEYPDISRCCYTCRSESCILEIERERLEKSYSAIIKKDIFLQGYEEEIEFKNKFNAGKASYIERNYEMINTSDFCIFYYNENYLPIRRKSLKDLGISTQGNSGTKLSFKYAKSKKKNIINIFK